MSLGIYKITNLINNKCYIGQSIDIERRFQEHKRDNDNCRIHQAIRKYGIENFSFEIIEECLQEELDKKEKYWIKYYDSFENGYNATAGGNQDIQKAIDFCKKEVYQYSKDLELLKKYESTREAGRQTGINPSHISACCRKERGSAGNFIWRYENDMPDKKLVRKKAIEQYDLENNYIASYDSIAEASCATGIHKAGIGQVCRNKLKLLEDTFGGTKNEVCWLKEK